MIWISSERIMVSPALAGLQSSLCRDRTIGGNAGCGNGQAGATRPDFSDNLPETGRAPRRAGHGRRRRGGRRPRPARGGARFGAGPADRRKAPRRSAAGPFPKAEPVRLLVVFALQRGAENIAQRGARVRGAELLHGLALLGDLAGLDRQAQTARLAVDVGDAHVDLVADL